MTASRSSGVVAALVAAAIAAAPPLAAQVSAPLDIVPQPVEAPEPIVEEPLPEPGPAVEVEVGAAGTVDPESVGLIEEADGGFGFDMWRGSDRGVVERLLPMLPTGLTSRAMNGLVRRLLLSTAAPPAGRAGINLLALRIERLAAMGDGVAVNHLMRASPPDLDDTMLAGVRLDALLLTADYVGACAQARDLVRRDDAPYWEKVLIFCQALSNRHDAAALGLALLRERGVEDDAFDTLLRALAGDADSGLTSLRDPTVLHIAMLRAARIPVPEDAIENADPALARAIALTASVPLELRLLAAERAEALDALPTDMLGELYASVPFTPEELADPLGSAKADKGPMARALLYQALRIQVIPAARAEVLRASWALGGEAGGWDGFATAARVTRDSLLSLNPSPELVWVAGDAVRALLASDRWDAIGGWLDLAAAQASANADAAAAVASLGPIAALADNDDAWTWDSARFTAWWESRRDLPEPDRRLRAATLVGLLAALGSAIPPEALLQMIDGPPTVLTRIPSPTLLQQLDSAADAGRVGETVLLALIVLDPAAPGVPSPFTLAAAVSALNRVGLEAEARAIAVEAALAREF